MNEFYVGCDASKGYGDFVILDARKKTMVDNFQLDDTFSGHNHLYQQLELFLKRHPGARLSAGIESTGGYESNWYSALCRFGASLNIRAAHINPVGIANDSKAARQRNITDKISAGNIAEYMIRHPEKVNYGTENPLSGLKRQWGYIALLKKQLTQLLNHLETLIYTSNPELLMYCRNGVQDWMLQLLLKYPTARQLASARVKTVSKIPFISEDRAAKLIERAKTSVASTVDEVSSQLLSSTVTQILHVKKVIRIQTEQLEKTCSMPEVDLLTSCTGIGKITALVLMIYIETVERFASSKKLAAYFGLHPEYKLSGDGQKGRFRMSKQGQPEPRKMLYMACMSGITANPLLKEIYIRKVEQGMAKKAAIGVCMHKMIRIVYGMLKNNTPFDAEIDRTNRNNAKNKTASKILDKSRRLQDYDSDAPISRRQNAKRMEQRPSQDGALPSRTGSDLAPRSS